MRSAAKMLACLACFLLYLLCAACVRAGAFFLRSPKRWMPVACLIRAFAWCLVHIIGVRIRVTGSKPYSRRGLFLVSNHLGYLDGFILGSLFPVIYSSKSELERWPLIGMMTALSGTLFFDRTTKSRMNGHIDKMASVLREGVGVLFFPEGTSTNGDALLAFKSAFFEAPIKAQADVLPVTLRYRCLDAEALTRDNRDEVYWYAEMTFLGHFWRLLSHRSVDVDVVLHETISTRPDAPEGASRKNICERAFEAVASGWAPAYRLEARGRVFSQRP